MNDRKINNNLMTKFRAIMILHSLGDTIGFKNGDWEFNYHDLDKITSLDYVNELIYEFIALGGVNGIDLKNWKCSDDTFFHIAIGKSLLNYKKKDGIDEKLINFTKDNMADEAERIWKESHGKYTDNNGTKIHIDRYIGLTTSNSIAKFSDKMDARYLPYDDNAGGNGAAMRTPIIGVCLRGDNNRDELIDYSIITSRTTHNNSFGYLAGFNAALFTALAVENVSIKKWPYILIEYLKSDKLKSYLSLKNTDQIYDHTMYIRYWKKYIDTKFDTHREPIISRANTNPMHRIRYYNDNFHKDTSSIQIGSSGFLCMIMAYDALLDCDGCWEKLIVYAILHNGDSDTIGAVAGALYGGVYGFGDVPEKMLKNIERKQELEELSLDLYKKFV
jgi:ADP-ribosylarginine hydrolase